MRRVRRAAPSNMSTLAPTTSIVCSIAVAVPVFGMTQLMHQNSQSRRDQRSRDHRGQQVLRSSREHRHQTNDNRKIRSCTVRIDGLSETQIFGGDWKDKTETTKAGYVPRLCPSGRRMPAQPYLTQKVTA